MVATPPPERRLHLEEVTNQLRILYLRSCKCVCLCELTVYVNRPALVLGYLLSLVQSGTRSKYKVLNKDRNHDRNRLAYHCSM